VPADVGDVLGLIYFEHRRIWRSIVYQHFLAISTAVLVQAVAVLSCMWEAIFRAVSCPCRRITINHCTAPRLESSSGWYEAAGISSSRSLWRHGAPRRRGMKHVCRGRRTFGSSYWMVDVNYTVCTEWRDSINVTLRIRGREATSRGRCYVTTCGSVPSLALFLADSTNGRAYATVLRPSVVGCA